MTWPLNVFEAALTDADDAMLEHHGIEDKARKMNRMIEERQQYETWW